MNLRKLLYPFSLIYGFVLFLRNRLYDLRLIRSVSFNLPVICIGNLRVGGEGKSPHIEYLLRQLGPEYKVAVLSRGYKRTSEGFQLAESSSSASEVGDEPLQFKRKFTDVPVAVDKDRVLGITHLLAAHGETDLILLDDAFQHRAVKAGLNILITSYNHLYTDDLLMPAGNLRESASGAVRADIIIVSKCPGNLSEEVKAGIEKKLKLSAGQRLYFTAIRYGALKSLSGMETSLPSSAASCLLLSGIADPSPLKQYCSDHYKLADHISYRDHHNYSKYDIELIGKKLDRIAQNEKFILTTEKDAMRLGAPGLQSYVAKLPLYYLPIEVYFLEKEQEFLNQVRNFVNEFSGPEGSGA